MMEEAAKHQTVFDTDQQHLGVVYAKALVAFGQKANKLDAIIAELDAVVNALEELPKLRSALESPRIGFSEKEMMLDMAFGPRVSKDMVNFLKVVGQKGRFDCLSSIRAAVHQMHDEIAGRVRATVTTAEPIAEQVKDKIVQELTKKLGKTVSVSTKLDPNIIGGMVVRIGDTVYDGSIVSQLSQVKSQAIKRVTDSIRESLDRFMKSK